MKRGELEEKGRVPRDATNEIKIRHGLDKWNNEVIDIRWYVENEPTRKGIRFNKKEAEHVYNLLGRIING
tara:strand:+ start:7992 stop:8201 length:210 start_codon:yes stop_codon:yes gene_type:complete